MLTRIRLQAKQSVPSVTGILLTLAEQKTFKQKYEIVVARITKTCYEYFAPFAGGSQQRVRANLYGALLNYLHIPQKPREIPTLQDNAMVLNSALLDEYECVTASNLAVMQEYGEGLMDLVCRDASDGHGVGRVSFAGRLTSLKSEEQKIISHCFPLSTVKFPSRMLLKLCIVT